jgi:hypothetical protein
MFNPRKFRLYVSAIRVWIYYDKVVLPDGRVVSVNPGKYFKIETTADGKTAIRFEDVVEEIGLKPDWDYNQPYCVIDSVSGFVAKSVSMRCRHTIGWAGDVANVLYYGNVVVARFSGFRRELYPVSFGYLDRDEALIAAAGGAAIGGGGAYAVTKDAKIGGIVSTAIAVPIVLLGILTGE